MVLFVVLSPAGGMFRVGLQANDVLRSCAQSSQVSNLDQIRKVCVCHCLIFLRSRNTAPRLNRCVERQLVFCVKEATSAHVQETVPGCSVSLSRRNTDESCL